MSEEVWAVVGLGNPGQEYAATRHNLGRMVVDELAARAGQRLKVHRRTNCETAPVTVAGHPVVLAATRTFMNESGGSVAALLRSHGVPPDHLVVVHDELDLPFGGLRSKLGGGDNGHNGLASVRRSLGTGDFLRVRLGIGRPPGRADAADYVLRAFKGDERAALPELVGRAADTVESLVQDGLDATQQRYNT